MVAKESILHLLRALNQYSIQIQVKHFKNKLLSLLSSKKFSQSSFRDINHFKCN